MAHPAGHRRNRTQEFREAWPVFLLIVQKNLYLKQEEKKRKIRGREGSGDIALRDEAPTWNPLVRRGFGGRGSVGPVAWHAQGPVYNQGKQVARKDLDFISSMSFRRVKGLTNMDSGVILHIFFKSLLDFFKFQKLFPFLVSWT